MKLKKKSIILIILSIYLITLVLGVSTFDNIALYNIIRRYLIVLLPALISLSIIIDNIKNLKVLLKNKIPLILYILIIIWLFITSFLGIKTGIETFKGLVHFSCLFTLILLLFNLDIDEEQKRIVKKHIFISFFICMIIGIIQYVFKINLNTFNNDKYPGILGRINSSFYIATTLDKYIILVFPLITYELLKDKYNKYYKLLLILSMFGITFTFSRSGQLVYLIMSFIFFVITLFKKQFKNTILIVLLICIMILIPGAKYSVQSALDYAYETAHIPNVIRLDFLKILGSDIKDVEAGKCSNNDCVGDIEGSKFFRDYYENVGKAFIKEYPVFGIGIGNTSYLYNNQNAKDYLKDNSIISDEYDYMYPHNCYIQLTEETGYIGTILVLIFIISLGIIKIIRSNSKMDCYIIIMILFALFIGNITEGLFYDKQIIYLFAIMYGIYSNNKRTLNE